MRRLAAYVLDVIPCLVLALLHFVPILGWIAFGLLAGLYWLLRDINGASFGKTIMGSVVLNADGSPSTQTRRIMRNVPLAIPALLEMIPLLGLVLGPVAACVILPLELLFLLFGGRRLGDVLAGTNVFRKNPGEIPVPVI